MIDEKLNILCMTIFSEDGDPAKSHEVIVRNTWKAGDIDGSPTVEMVELGMKSLRQWANENYPDYKDWKVRAKLFVSKP
jgi:hypothetical protein